MCRLFGILIFIVYCTILYAADWSGDYSGESSNGTVRLKLQQQGNKLIGSFTTADDWRYSVEGIEQNGEIAGTMKGSDGTFFFHGTLDSGSLRFRIIPPNEDGEPDHESGLEIMMENKTKASQPQAETPEDSGKSKGLSGNYQATLNGAPTTLRLQQDGAKISGTIDSGGYKYTLDGKVQLDKAEGTLKDPQTGGAGKFEAAAGGNQLTFVIIATDPQTGETHRIPVEFNREGAKQSAKPAEKVAGELDPSMIGTWARQEVMSGGGMSIATQVFFVLNSNGTYEHGNARTVGGGADWSGDTGNSGDVTRGKWRTQSSILYLDSGNGWQPVGRYYVERGKMLLTYNNGSREIWYRE